MSIVLSYLSNLKYYGFIQKLHMLKLAAYNIKHYALTKN
jgi:hypothetical protein